MGSQLKQSLKGNIHKIREFELEKVNLVDEFDILQIVGEGWFGKILLVEHKATDTEMVLKALPKPYTALKDFYREFHYGLHLGVHKNIITAYDVAFETAGFFVFSQEYAPLGDLTSNVSDIGIGELHTKRVAKQLAAALEHMHNRELVHRDIKLDNILVFKSDFSRIKLCDFGETRKAGSTVLRRNEWLPYAAPEILEVPTDGTYTTNTSHDVWQFGIVIFVCLTGCLPWQKAATDDPRYVRYLSWQSATLPLKRQPKMFKLVSSKAQRLFKKYLEPRAERRPSNLSDIYRYLEDRLMSKGMEKTNETAKEEEGLCPSMYSFHSSPEEKNKLLFSLTQYGLETTVDRNAKKDRIRQWIQTSVIEEENEDEAQSDQEIHDNQNGPIGERVEHRGPISEGNVKKHHSHHSKRERILSTLRREDGVFKPPVDPRIPFTAPKSSDNSSKSHQIFENNRQTTTNDSQNSTMEENLITSNTLTKKLSPSSSTETVSKEKQITFKKTNIQNSLSTSIDNASTDNERTHLSNESQLNADASKNVSSSMVSRNFSIYNAIPFKKIQVPKDSNNGNGIEKRPFRKIRFEEPEEIKIRSLKSVSSTESNSQNNCECSKFDELFNKSNSNNEQSKNSKTKAVFPNSLPFKNVQVFDDSPQNSSGSSGSSVVKHNISIQLPQSDIVAHNLRSTRESHRKVLRQKQ